MRISFDERFDLPVKEVFSYFETPRDWTRLYGLAGRVEELEDGWFAVPLRRFPFPLVARNTRVEPERLVRWTFRGFWRGEGEVFFSETSGGVTVRGYEEISVRWLGPLSPLVEKLFLERLFRSIWKLGWSRLRKAEQARAAGG
ncbi:MAG: hypothetical protein OES32_12150 [Acidobacteriota bacterium]|nr:hypothetical protein [Acidobacteriota bacterium]